jgi:endonuclease YncB( thermonuclease family)
MRGPARLNSTPGGWRRYPYWRRRNPQRSRLARALDYALTVAIIGALLFAVSRLDQVSTRTNAGQAKVHDGDTLTVQDERVRLRGIDAPEYRQTCRADSKDYPCGRMALQALAKMVAGKQVKCEGWQRDRYDRLLGNCRTTNPNLDINAEMVRSGWALAYGDYESEEWSARQRRVGLWQGDFQRPRDWRAEHDSHVNEPAHDGAQSLINWLRQLFLR